MAEGLRVLRKPYNQSHLKIGGKALVLRLGVLKNLYN